MKFYNKILCSVGGCLLLLQWPASEVKAANAVPLGTDINIINTPAFGPPEATFFGGKFIPSDTATLNSNDVLSIHQDGTGVCCHGASVVYRVSNGENGIDQSFDGPTNMDVNNDIPNATAANTVFATIGNASNKLENGNVLRFSAWFRSDPNNPITLDPQVQPILKFEFWKEALSGFADTNPGQIQPFYGDKVFDQDQHGGQIPLAAVDLPQWIDLNGDGQVLDTSAAGQGRVTSISTSAWTLAEVTYTVDDSLWLGINDDVYTVDKIEMINAVMFMGDFASTNLTGDGNGGNLLMDNALVEVFKNAASVTPNTNPNPTLSEGIAGDYNGNGKVDAADYVLWRNDAGSFGGNPAGFNTWRSNFGNPPGIGSSLSSPGAIPEPTLLTLVAIVAGGLIPAHRRR